MLIFLYKFTYLVFVTRNRRSLSMVIPACVCRDHRDILLEATSSQKLGKNGLRSDAPTLLSVLLGLKQN